MIKDFEKLEKPLIENDIKRDQIEKKNAKLIITTELSKTIFYDKK